MAINYVTPYADEALHTTSRFLLERDFDLSLSSMHSNSDAIAICKEREQKVYQRYGCESLEEFLQKTRNSFLANQNDKQVFERFQYQNMVKQLSALAKEQKGERTKKLTEDYELTIKIDEKANPEIEKLFRDTFGVKSRTTLKLGVSKNKFNKFVKEVKQQMKSKKTEATFAETVQAMLNQEIEGLILFGGGDFSAEEYSEAFELDQMAHSFPWGFKKADIERALTENGQYRVKLEQAYNVLRRFFTETLAEGGSTYIKRAAEIVWEEKLGNKLSSSISFFEKGDVKNLQIGAAGEYAAAMMFVYFELIYGISAGTEISTISGDQLRRGVQGKVDVELLKGYGIQVKNYDLIYREAISNHSISTGTNIGYFSEYLSKEQAQDLRLFFANYYFNKTFADQRTEIYTKTTQELNKYAYALYSLALADSLEDDRVSFYLVGSKYLIPASAIIEAFEKKKKNASIKSVTTKIRGINRQTDEEFEANGTEHKYWRQASNLSYYPTDLNKEHYENLVYRHITISSHINYKEIIGDLENSLYALY